MTTRGLDSSSPMPSSGSAPTRTPPRSSAAAAIGSNDLTQLTLGVDRDSALLAHLFDEQDPGVKALIAQVARVAHQHDRKVGLCGQGPSDHPELASFLASIGIDSISVTPDALAAVVATLAPERAAAAR